MAPRWWSALQHRTTCLSPRCGMRAREADSSSEHSAWLLVLVPASRLPLPLGAAKLSLSLSLSVSALSALGGRACRTGCASAWTLAVAACVADCCPTMPSRFRAKMGVSRPNRPLPRSPYFALAQAGVPLQSQRVLGRLRLQQPTKALCRSHQYPSQRTGRPPCTLQDGDGSCSDPRPRTKRRRGTGLEGTPQQQALVVGKGLCGRPHVVEKASMARRAQGGLGS